MTELCDYISSERYDLYHYNLRREILKGLLAEGHEVSAMCQVLQFEDELEQLGCDVINIETARQWKKSF